MTTLSTTPPTTAPTRDPVPAPPVPSDDHAAGRTRLLGMDAARGLAVLGMMAVHSLYVANDDGSPTAMYSVIAGRSAAVFAVLAGVGIAFTTGRRRVRGGPAGRAAAASLLTRALVVGLIGLALGYTDAEIAASILPYYALLFAFAIPLVFLPTSALLALGTLVAGGMPVLSHVIRPGLPAPSLENPTVTELVADPAAMLSELTLTGYYPALPWIAYACVGIAIGRLRLSTARVATILLAVGTTLAVAATVASWWLLGPLGGLTRIAAATPAEELATVPTVADFVTMFPEGVTPTTTWWWLATTAPHSSTPLDMAQTIGSAVAVIGALLLVEHVTRPVAARMIGLLIRPLAAVGALTLTVYTAHMVFLNSPLDDFDPVPGYLLQVAVAALFASGWRLAVGRGPLESLVRVLAQAAGRVAAGGRR